MEPIKFPSKVKEYLSRLLIETRSPAYLHTAGDGRLIDWGGDIEAYGLQSLQRNQPIGAQVFFLSGFLPLNEGSLHFPCVKPSAHLSTDIYIFHADDGDWTLLLDATEEELRQKRLQQKGNELRLLRKEMDRLLQNVNKPGSSPESQKQTPRMFRKKGEYREVAVLFADIHEFTAYSESESPEVMLKTLYYFIDVMIHAIADGGGYLDKIIGDAVMGVFGLLPTGDAPGNLAVQAGLKMQNDIAELNILRHKVGEPTFDISIGIATGPVALGMMENIHPKTISAIGRVVNLAAAIQKQAWAGEILIDPATYETLWENRGAFSKTVKMRNNHQSLTAFAYRPLYE